MTKLICISLKGARPTFFKKTIVSHKNQEIHLSKNTQKYVNCLKDKDKILVIATGPSGTGKTMMASLVGLDHITHNDYKKIIITRPTIPVGGESLGFLPGELDDKMRPWVEHMIEYIDSYDLKSVRNKMNMLPLSYIRGHTFKDTWIIADEMQNSTQMQMKTLLTRVGENCKIVLTGDLSQCDLDTEENGLMDLIERLSGDEPAVEQVTFSEDDIQRSEFVKDILKLYAHPNRGLIQ